MRQSMLFVNTLREAPSDAEVHSHKLLVRAGYIRQLAAGVYTYMPLGLRVLRKIERLIRQELERAGAQELLMPALQPTGLWKESGRYDDYGPELFRLQDRHHREFALGPTHEEIITALVKTEIGSYRKLPVILYQIQTKFRDERRPRYGLLRGREFMMKDAYSFDTGWEGLNESYRKMYEAYTRIFERCGLTFAIVEADAGAIGGEGETHEFMALSDVGEDTIVACTSCSYAANMETATSRLTPREAGSGPAAKPACERVHTPEIRTVEELTRYLQLGAEEVIKTLVYLADGQPYAVVVRGDHEVSELKLKRCLQATTVQLADASTVREATGAPHGYIGPVGLNIPIIADTAVLQMTFGVAGANEADYHLTDVMPERDFSAARQADLRQVNEGDRCPHCEEGTLQFSRGIEIGHVFKLGTRYSNALQARYLDAAGKEQDMIMGCYGIGVSRLLSAIAEQQHDERGLVWSPDLAPYHAHLIPVSGKDAAQLELAGKLYETLRQHGIDVLYDDREERAGVKFADADLIGLPVRIVVGREAAQGKVEVVERSTGNKEILSLDEAVAKLARDRHG
ncbi:prolyl-tRNA synthetase [Paenibacillus sp. UNCCL117]|uniref:proline--tRNA ligase n=1 Tax=unclassified Paenibacillus TaxID=185978 RepID=UPI00088AE304|nr:MULTISPECIES: proline--tRNA ligase [unclassified Paenibacillus]SDC94086.1 prolyl-tRNA synthetase [Paenibacillus sp. cl123]SFW29731.1 prolyl-tRNA synthetase [Paenibacillus sp. UNCCL117]